jgi:tetratricopeptide (TPR) repeat protein
MAGLVARDGAHRLTLDVLTMSESLQLLAAVGVDASRADIETRSELAHRSAHLPLALRLTGELMASRPHASAAEHLAGLTAARALDRLDTGDDQETSLRAAFSWSYRHLRPDAARAFRLLGIHPGRVYTADAAAALAGVLPREAEVLLHVLRRSHLLEDVAEGQYALHDLLHAYAMELAQRDPESEAAWARLLDHYIKRAATARRLAYPYDRSWPTATSSQRALPTPGFASATEAIDWLELELRNLIAAASLAHSSAQVIELVAQLDRYLNTRGYYAENTAVLKLVLGKSRETNDQVSEGRAMARLGRILGQTGQYGSAKALLSSALQLGRSTDDPNTLYQALLCLGNVYRDLGRHSDAFEVLRQAAAIGDAQHDPWWQAEPLCNIGVCYEDIAEYDQAIECYQKAMTLHRAAKYRGGEAAVHDNLGSVFLRVGRVSEAVDHLANALAIAEETHNLDVKVGALNRIGQATLASGQHDQAYAYHTSALELARQIGDGMETVLAVDGLGDIAEALGQTDEARRRWTEAYDAGSAIGLRIADGIKAKLDRVKPDESRA